MRNMNEIARIVDQHIRAFDGDPWYGHPLTRLLSGISAREAAARPIPSAHSIWEIVLHIAAWEGAVLERLTSGIVAVPDQGDWPPVPATTAEAWNRALEILRTTHSQVIEAMRRVDKGHMDTQLGAERDLAVGSGHTIGTTMHGIIQHNVYHAGQIALLRKALEPAEPGGTR